MVGLPALHGLRGDVRPADPAAGARRLRRRARFSHRSDRGLPGGRATAAAALARRRAGSAGAAVRCPLRLAQRAPGQPHGDGRRSAADRCRRRRAVRGAAARRRLASHRPRARRDGAGVHRVCLRRAATAGLSLSRRRVGAEPDRSADADDAGRVRHPDARVGNVHLPVRRVRQRDVVRRPPALLHRRRAGRRRSHPGGRR